MHLALGALLLVMLHSDPVETIIRHVPAEPCMFPLPFTHDFDVFCQLDYHMTPYVCDPTGIISRTEAELLNDTVHSLNMSSCFCGSACEPGAVRLGIVILPNATTRGLEACDQSLDFSLPLSPSVYALGFAAQLSERWSKHCNADLLLIYINFASQRPTYSFIVPYYSNGMERLQRLSRPRAVSTRESLLTSLRNALAHSKRLRDSTRPHIYSTTVPSWALWTGAGLLAFVAILIYLANCITNIGGDTQKQKPLLSSSRKQSGFRAGFGGGMIMNSSQQKKSVMMFRTFSKPQRYEYGTNSRL